MNQPLLLTALLPTGNTHFSGIVGGAAAFLQGQSGWVLDTLGAAKFGGQTAGRIIACFSPYTARDGIPAVNVSNSLVDSGLPTVVSDDCAVGELAAQFFLEHGLDAFAVFAPCHNYYGQLRSQGFERTLARRGHKTLSIGGPGFFESMKVTEAGINVARIQALLAQLPRPCAIFGVDDLKAALLCRMALSAGYRVPEDFLILGVDDNRTVCDSTPVPLSSIALDSRGIGYRAAELLVTVLECPDTTAGSSAPPRIELLPLKVVERASTATGARRDPLVSRALFLIDREFNQPLRVESLAQRLGVSTRYLQQRFKQTLGQSPLEILLERRLKEAQTLLRESSLSITDIAYATGFSDYKQLAHHLRRTRGLTAKEIREGRK